MDLYTQIKAKKTQRQIQKDMQALRRKRPSPNRKQRIIERLKINREYRDNLSNPDAHRRAMQMMNMPSKALPKRARDYADYLGRIYGLCGEVILSAFCHYAQAVEGLPCKNEMYKIDAQGVQFFNK